MQEARKRVLQKSGGSLNNQIFSPSSTLRTDSEMNEF